MKTIIFTAVCDDEVGEVEGMFLPNGELLGLWSCNDATWRGEYFQGFMSEIDVEVVDGFSEEWSDKLREAAIEHWGL